MQTHLPVRLPLNGRADSGRRDAVDRVGDVLAAGGEFTLIFTRSSPPSVAAPLPVAMRPPAEALPLPPSVTTRLLLPLGFVAVRSDPRRTRISARESSGLESLRFVRTARKSSERGGSRTGGI
jgi:hypothetical protein